MKAFITSATIAASIGLFATAPAALAGEGSSCHFHGSKPAPQETVAQCAAARKATLVKSGKLDAGWETVKEDKIQQIDGKKGKEWLVTYKNPATKDAAKSTLYMYFSLPGNFLAANFTGQ